MEPAAKDSNKIPDKAFASLCVIALAATGLGALLFSIVLFLALDMGPFDKALYASFLGFAFTIIPNLFRLMKLYKKIDAGQTLRGEEIFIEGCKHGIWVYAATAGMFLAGCLLLIGLPLLFGAVIFFFPALAPISVVCGIFTVAACSWLHETMGHSKDRRKQ